MYFQRFGTILLVLVRSNELVVVRGLPPVGIGGWLQRARQIQLIRGGHRRGVIVIVFYISI